MELNIGALAALGTAFAWTLTALAFEYAGKRIGAVALNFLRLVIGCLFLGLYCLATRGGFFPFDAPLSAWIWLGISGIVGLVVGDLLLFQAFIDIGSRVAMLVYATAPAFTAMLGFIVFGERISLFGVGGMCLTLAGIAIVVFGRRPAAEVPAPAVDAVSGAAGGASPTRAAEAAGRGRAPRAPENRPHRVRGLLLAAGATLGQAGGLILSKIGAGSGAGAMNPFAGTQIRVAAGVLGFAIALLATRSWRGIWTALRDGKAVASLSLGSFFGPFLGVSLSLLAIQSGNTGIASAIMSIVPVLIIAPSALILKERVTMREILGSVLAVAGVFALFLA
jgi:drug/metabolite transporter (DMT)-like permease